MLKLYLTDGTNHAIGIDPYGVLIAAYLAFVGNKSNANGDFPSIQAFFAGAKVRALLPIHSFVVHLGSSCYDLGWCKQRASSERCVSF